MTWIAFSGLAVLLLYVGLCCVLYWMQDRLLYLPTAESNPREATALLIPSGDAVLKVWQLHPNAGPALIYFGGNAEDVAANLPDFDPAFPDRAIYLVNYRGYGGSTGTPSEAALIADAQAVYDTLRARHERIAVMGRSLGSGVATALTTTRPVEKLILVTPYDSMANVAADHLRWAPIRWLIKDRYDSARRIKEIRIPALVVIAERDEVIFRARSDSLVNAMPAVPHHVLVIPHATHNDIGGYPQYLQGVKAFLTSP